MAGEAVDVGRLDIPSAVAAEVSIAEVVGVDDEDVGARGGELGLRPRGGGLGTGRKGEHC